MGVGANHQAYSRDRRLAEPLQPLNGGSNIGETSRALSCTPRCPCRLREHWRVLSGTSGVPNLAPHLHIFIFKRSSLRACRTTRNDSHSCCTREPQTSGQCKDCWCEKTAGLNRYFFTAPTTPDVANVHFTGDSPAKVASLTVKVGSLNIVKV